MNREEMKKAAVDTVVAIGKRGGRSSPETP